MPREGLGLPSPTRSIPRHVTGLLNNGSLLKTVNLAANAGSRKLPVIKLHTKKTLPSKVRVR